MPKLSPQNKSFLILLGIIVIGSVFGYLMIWKINSADVGSPDKGQWIAGDVLITKHQTSPAPNFALPAPAVDTSNWPVYKNDKYGLTFKYSPDWKVLPETKQGDYNLIQIDPGKKFYNIIIYISQTDFYVMDGLPEVTVDINGLTAQSVEDLLFGIKKAPYYFTFDVGKSLSLKPRFDALVRSVKFQ